MTTRKSFAASSFADALLLDRRRRDTVGMIYGAIFPEFVYTSNGPLPYFAPIVPDKMALTASGTLGDFRLTVHMFVLACTFGTSIFVGLALVHQMSILSAAKTVLKPVFVLEILARKRPFPYHEIVSDSSVGVLWPRKFDQ